MATFGACDRCVQKTALFLADVLGPNSRSALSVSLPSKARAMLASCASATSSSQQDEKLISTAYSKLNVYERASPVVKYAPLSRPAVQDLLSYQNFSRSMLEAANQAPPSEWILRIRTANASFVPSNDSLTYSSADAALQVSVMNRNCTAHSQCWDHNAPTGMRPWWFCAHPNLCSSQPGACSEEAETLLLSGPKCARGPCSSPLAAVDKQCPVNAICPAETGSVLENPSPYFGQKYFSKFDSKIRADGAGVCDCAFANGVVADECEFARCLAYASLMESEMTCNAGLVQKCNSILSSNAVCASDSTLSCSYTDTVVSYPPSLVGQCKTNPLNLADQTSLAPSVMSVRFFALFVIVFLSLM
jgi:hypothetical protein